jgi:predicted O-linked N-acetylglucosamine transferase (SPINDLY family)
LVARDLEDYESIALKLAADREALVSLRQKLWLQRLEMPLFDVERIRKISKQPMSGC